MPCSLFWLLGAGPLGGDWLGLPWGYPIVDGFFCGKSHLEMDELGAHPYDSGNLHVVYQPFWNNLYHIGFQKMFILVLFETRGHMMIEICQYVSRHIKKWFSRDVRQHYPRHHAQLKMCSPGCVRHDVVLRCWVQISGEILLSSWLIIVFAWLDDTLLLLAHFLLKTPLTPKSSSTSMKCLTTGEFNYDDKRLCWIRQRWHVESPQEEWQNFVDLALGGPANQRKKAGKCQF